MTGYRQLDHQQWVSVGLSGPIPGLLTIRLQLVAAFP
jgi:hypothetical protein